MLHWTNVFPALLSFWCRRSDTGNWYSGTYVGWCGEATTRCGDSLHFLHFIEKFLFGIRFVSISDRIQKPMFTVRRCYDEEFYEEKHNILASRMLFLLKSNPFILSLPLPCWRTRALRFFVWHTKTKMFLSLLIELWWVWIETPTHMCVQLFHFSFASFFRSISGTRWSSLCGVCKTRMKN